MNGNGRGRTYVIHLEDATHLSPLAQQAYDTLAIIVDRFGSIDPTLVAVVPGLSRSIERACDLTHEAAGSIVAWDKEGKA